MPRTAQNPLAAKEFGLRLRQLRDAHPDKPSPKQIERKLLTEWGLEVSDETIRKAHSGLTDPGQCDSDLVLALRAFYECEPEELGEFAARRIVRARVLALVGGGNDHHPTGGNGAPDLGESRSGWKGELTERTGHLVAVRVA